jgi:GDP-D-mannose 3',5'-epimerase
VYPACKLATDVRVLKEKVACPAQPQNAQGWEKLISERLCTDYREDYGLEIRTVRFHNICGPRGTWDGGRGEAPVARWHSPR